MTSSLNANIVELIFDGSSEEDQKWLEKHYEELISFIKRTKSYKDFANRMKLEKKWAKEFDLANSPKTWEQEVLNKCSSYRPVFEMETYSN